MRYSTFVFALCFILILISGVNSSHFFQNWLSSPTNETEVARKKKRGGKYVKTILFAALMIKAIIFPLAFKVMAVMSSVSVLLSTMSLIISSIVGYAKTVIKSASPHVKFLHKHPHSWAKDDNIKNYNNPVENYYDKVVLLPANEQYANGAYIPLN